MTPSPPLWQLSVDTGGTFTDCLALDPSGALERVKVLSSGALRSRVAERITPLKLRLNDCWSTPPGFFKGFTATCLSPGIPHPISAAVADWHPEQKILTLTQAFPENPPPDEMVELTTGEDAPVLGARLLTHTGLNNPFPHIHLRLATTRGTNALLERKVAPVLFLVTKGFADLLRIRDQRRADLFALKHQPTPVLYKHVIEIPERLSADGTVLTPLEPDDDLLAQIKKAVDHGIDSAAVALLHSYQNPEHETILHDHLKALGLTHISLSSDLAPLIGIVSRAETTVVNASLAPIMDAFFDHVESPLHSAPQTPQLLIMTSAGGLKSRSSSHAKDTLLSGPAGGVVGAATIARALDHHRIISFDMGGTSTDVARFDHDFLYRFDQRVGDAHLFATALKIETVAAGGGSICDFDPVAGLSVGPDSAGADPGPACYGRGGPLTITDVNFLLDRIAPNAVSIPFDRRKAEQAFQSLLERMNQCDADLDERIAILHGLLDIAVERTANAINTISLREGADPAKHALLAFGGAGPLHACAVADKLNIKTIIVPADAGLLSARGLQHAAIERVAEKQVLLPLQQYLPSLPRHLEHLESQAITQLLEEGIPKDSVCIRRRIAELRLAGQDATLATEITPSQLKNIPLNFENQYDAIYGYKPPKERSLELVTLRVIASTTNDQVNPESVPPSKSATSPTAPASVRPRASLKPGDSQAGPALIPDPYSTLFVAPGWNASLGSKNSLILTKTTVPNNERSSTDHTIAAELFRHRFQNVVESMGALLQRSALSTNIKERADFSCALLDAKGRLIVNAPHIPVHLGALGLCVRKVIESRPLNPGDMVVTNHPAFGGSHLPDVTVISPVHDDEDQLIAFIANRAHHAEIGGITPGSMPPHAKYLSEEGVLIPPTLLFEEGRSHFNSIRKCLTNAPHPSRNPEDNLADLNAQSAANLHGLAGMKSLITEHGSHTIATQLENLYERSRQALRNALATAPLPASSSAVEALDDNTTLHVTLSQTGTRLHIDLTGTAPHHPGNLNATPAIVQSAILYALRLYVQSNLPLNEGLLHDTEITLPNCFLNPTFPEDPNHCPPVVGGNVETSQRLVDTLLKALRLQACSQGTMNNLIFGDKTFGYYETIAGGAGAGHGYDGAHALHTHMTNTAITDPEILEYRYPARLRRFAVRKNSGGKGTFSGGDGVIREFEFLAPLTVSLLTQHRIQSPYGLEGGLPARPGRQTHFPTTGPANLLPPAAQIEVSPGDRLRIETPGGGGWGEPV
ncbi:MAG: hydantoinase B/oxoprolinase family protein [Verrucomicrobiota bacterium]